MSADFQSWIGRSETALDVLGPQRSNALLASFGRAERGAPGDALPLLHHWLYFWDVQPPAALGHDGHPALGGFLPPVPLPRRMWAGGRVEFVAPLRLGEAVTRVSTIRAISQKAGRSGRLIFVTVAHDISGEAGVAVREEQDLVYREAATTGLAMPEPAPAPEATWHEQVACDATLFFRYSALTMNGHRIHYDRDFAAGQERYQGLVVHGPMQATLMVALAARQLAQPIRHFTYRGLAPAFDGAALHICGEPDDGGAAMWTQQGGVRNMEASVRC